MLKNGVSFPQYLINDFVFKVSSQSSTRSALPFHFIYWLFVWLFSVVFELEY